MIDAVATLVFAVVCCAVGVFTVSVPESCTSEFEPTNAPLIFGVAARSLAFAASVRTAPAKSLTVFWDSITPEVNAPSMNEYTASGLSRST